MKSFSFTVKQEINFGIGCLEELPGKILSRNLKRVLISSDPAFERNGILKKIEEMLNRKGIEFVTFTDIEPEPSSKTVAKAVQVYKENDVECVVCLGGGSAIDVGKTTALVAANGGKVEDYKFSIDNFRDDLVKNPVAPIIAIPTTAGTGSEVTRDAIITNSNNFKFAVINESIQPQCVLLDPQLLATLPPKVAASAGMDALTHAIEGYISRDASPFSDLIAEKAIELIGANIRSFVARRDNIESASGMLLGSTFAGITLNLAFPGNAHALSHPLGGLFHIPHGIAVAVLLPVVLEFNALADTGKYEKIYRLLTGDQSAIERFNCEMLISEIKNLNKAIGIPSNFSEFGLTKESIPQLVKDALEFRKLYSVNPRETTPEDVEKLFLQTI